MAERWRADKDDVEEVTDFLTARRKLRHLRVRRRGPLLTLESGSTDDPIPHARFRRTSVHLWTLECATHTGRWERTGYRATLAKLLTLLTKELPWVLAPRDFPHNPEENSGTRY